jgi:hypothetical protein
VIPTDAPLGDFYVQARANWPGQITYSRPYLSVQYTLRYLAINATGYFRSYMQCERLQCSFISALQAYHSPRLETRGFRVGDTDRRC